jgi:membrane protein required for colicin V production
VVNWANLGAIDWVIVVVLSVSVALSLWRGFVREAISLAGWVVAFVIANLYVEEMTKLLAPWIANGTGRYVAAYAILFVLTLVVAGVIRRLAVQAVKVSGLSLLDRVLGTAFGFARGVILILVAVYLLRQLGSPQNLQWLDQSELMPHVDMLAQWAQTVFYSINNGQGAGVISQFPVTTR